MASPGGWGEEAWGDIAWGGTVGGSVSEPAAAPLPYTGTFGGARRMPSGRILRNTVRLQRINFGSDPDGGRIPIPSGLPSAPIRCRVHPRNAIDLPAHMREEGHAYYEIHFFGSTPPPLKIRDLVYWDDFQTPQELSVSGTPVPAAGEMGTWIVQVEYVVPPTEAPGGD